MEEPWKITENDFLYISSILLFSQVLLQAYAKIGFAAMYTIEVSQEDCWSLLKIVII